ncbi:MurR/RpiR family transcriptional regulator [Rummeliibacillus sp. JY-2-4R]
MYPKLIHKHFFHLSELQKKVANYILEFPYDVALRSPQEIGEMLGVSVTTLNRFCYAIELSGYGELQSVIRRSLMKNKRIHGIYN